MTGGAGFGGSQPGAPPSLPGGGGAIPGKRLATKPDAPLFIRQHALKKLGKKLEKDFTQTVFWHPVLILPKGKAQIEFPWTPGSMGYSITVFGHTLDGRLGATTLKTTVTK